MRWYWRETKEQSDGVTKVTLPRHRVLIFKGRHMCHQLRAVWARRICPMPRASLCQRQALPGRGLWFCLWLICISNRDSLSQPRENFLWLFPEPSSDATKLDPDYGPEKNKTYHFSKCHFPPQGDLFVKYACHPVSHLVQVSISIWKLVMLELNFAYWVNNLPRTKTKSKILFKNMRGKFIKVHNKFNLLLDEQGPDMGPDFLGWLIPNNHPLLNRSEDGLTLWPST